jgi:type IV pilus assembly protein PilN
MRSQINLATEPFRRDRLILVASSVAAVVLLVTLALLSMMIAGDRRSMAASLSALDRTQTRLSGVQSEQRKLDAALRQSGNADVLERSQFINALLYRKGISWTRLFADMGKVMPPNVRVLSIRPSVDSNDHISLDMVVAADTPKPVLDLLAKFEESDLFGSPSMYGVIPPSQTDPSYRYRLSVNYAQKL